LAAGPCPDPLGELIRSPRPPIAAMGPASKEMVGTGEDLLLSKGAEGREGKRGDGKGGEGIFPQSQAE